MCSLSSLSLSLSPPVDALFSKKEKRPRVNRKQDMDKEKIATTVDMEDIGDKKVFCRCWRSDKV